MRQRPGARVTTTQRRVDRPDRTHDVHYEAQAERGKSERIEQVTPSDCRGYKCSVPTRAPYADDADRRDDWEHGLAADLSDRAQDRRQRVRNRNAFDGERRGHFAQCRWPQTLPQLPTTIRIFHAGVAASRLAGTPRRMGRAIARLPQRSPLRRRPPTRRMPRRLGQARSQRWVRRAGQPRRERSAAQARRTQQGRRFRGTRACANPVGHVAATERASHPSTSSLITASDTSRRERAQARMPFQARPAWLPQWPIPCRMSCKQSHHARPTSSRWQPPAGREKQTRLRALRVRPPAASRASETRLVDQAQARPEHGSAPCATPVRRESSAMNHCNARMPHGPSRGWLARSTRPQKMRERQRSPSPSFRAAAHGFATLA